MTDIVKRNYKESELREAERFKEGKPNSHLANDSSQYLSAHVFLTSVRLMVVCRG